MKPNRFLLFLGLILSAVYLCDISIAQEQTGQSFTLSTNEIITDLAGNTETFPTYTTQLINLANQNSQATRPLKVGQMSELIHTFPGKTYDEWVQWYGNIYPDAIDKATNDTFAMIQKMRHAMSNIDRNMVHAWIRELILAKTYAGLRFQESILKKIAQKENSDYRLSNPDEEAKGIDGYIGVKPISIKPTSYNAKPFLPEEIPIEIIYYEKIRGGIRVFY